MRKTTALSAAIAFAVAGLLAAPLASADPPPPPPPPAAPNPPSPPPSPQQQGMHGHQGGMMGDLRQLNLSTSQRRSIMQALRANHEQMQGQMQTLQQKRDAYNAAVPGSPGYQDAVNNLAQAEAASARARVTQEANLRAQINTVLTPDQRTQLANLQAQHKTQMQQWRQQSHGRRMSPDQSSSSDDDDSGQ